MRMIEEIDFSVKAGTDSDFEFFITSPEISWRWDVVSPGGTVGSEILFKHLILPLINVAGLAFNSSEAFSAMSDAALTQSLDKMARTTRVTGSHTELKKFFSKPRVTTALQRAVQVVAYSPNPNAIVSSVDETPPTGTGSGMPPHGNLPSRLQPDPQPHEQVTSPYVVAKSEPVRRRPSPSAVGPSTRVNELEALHVAARQSPLARHSGADIFPAAPSKPTPAEQAPSSDDGPDQIQPKPSKRAKTEEDRRQELAKLKTEGDGASRVSSRGLVRRARKF